MAVIKLGPILAGISGKLGGTVFGRNKGGNFARLWSHPINPRSVLQQQRRAYASAAAAAWGGITAQQRSDWQAYAVNTTWTNKLGETINIGGEAAFVRLNALYGLMGYGPNAAAPLAYGHAPATVSTITASAGSQTPILAEPSAGFDGATSGTKLLIFASMPQPGSRAMAPNRFQFLQKLIGNAGSPIGWPLTLDTYPWTYSEDQKVTIGMVQTDEKQRVSVRTFASAIAAA